MKNFVLPCLKRLKNCYQRQGKLFFKQVISLLIIFLVGCVTPKKSRVLDNSTMPTESIISGDKRELLRTSEVVKAYPVGRYVESDSGRVMHEKHTVYRVEKDSDWQLRNEEARKESLNAGIKVAEVNPGYLSALVEQNAVLEKKIRVLEQEHSQCLVQRNNCQFEELKTASSLVGQEKHEGSKKNRSLPFRMDSPPPLTKDSKPSLSLAE